MFEILCITAGALLLLTTLTDVIGSTIGTGSGPVLRRVVPPMWRVGLWVHRRTGSHRLLAHIGKALVVLTLAMWIAMLWTSWTLIFSGSAAAVVDYETGQPASLIDRIYFVGSTLTSLGRGDHVPVGAPWVVLNILAVITGTFLITFGISYLMPVIQAETRRRAISLSVHSMGTSPVQILASAWHNDCFDALEVELRGIGRELAQLQQDHLAYPMLHYMHARRASEAVAVQMAVLDEMLTILQTAFDEPPLDPFLLSRLTTTLTYFLESMATAHIEIVDEVPPPPRLAALREAGIPVADEAGFREEMGRFDERRRLLLSLLLNDGWSWRTLDSTEPHLLESAEQALGVRR